MRFCIFIFLIFFTNFSWSKTPSHSTIHTTSWTLEALRLTGESEGIHDRAVHRLLKIPHLKKMLRNELVGPRRNLALDVISSLGFEDFIPELLELAKNESSGIFYLSIDSLITVRNQKMVAAAYRERLLCAKACGVSPAAEVLILDTLAQLGEKISYQELIKIYNDGWYEVKSSALNYARAFLIRGDALEFLALVANSLESPLIQLRWQAVYLLSELPASLRSQVILSSLKKCEWVKDPRTPVSVQKICSGLIGGLK